MSKYVFKDERDDDDVFWMLVTETYYAGGADNGRKNIQRRAQRNITRCNDNDRKGFIYFICKKCN